MNNAWAVAVLSVVALAAAQPSLSTPDGAASARQAQTPTPTPQVPAQNPVFRAGIDLVRLDVSVLDRDRRPVRGLVAGDFHVFEDGVEQEVAAFDAVEVPGAVTPTATWMRRVTPDVTTNDLPDGRLFMMVLDDATIPGDPRAVSAVKPIAKSVVEKLGPTDLMTVVFTRDNRNAQDFTGDHAKLLRAIDRFTLGFATMPIQSGPGIDTDWYYKTQSVETLVKAAEFLIALPDRRKVLIYVSVGVPVSFDEAPTLISSSAGAANRMGGEVNSRLAERTAVIFDRARKANVNVYTIDPCGLRVADGQRGCQPGAEVDFLNIVASNTGGRPLVNTAEYEQGIQQIFSENDSYYLIGYRPANATNDGRYRRIEVKVDREGVEVRTRSGYNADSERAAAKNLAKSATVSPLAKAVAGLLPETGLPMRIVAAPFWTPGKSPTVALTLGVTPPLSEHAAGDRIVETIELQTSAYSIEGDLKGSARQTAKVTLRAGATGTVPFEVLSKIDLKPGRYSLRLAAHSSATSTSGSVYADVIVPDFDGEPLVFSGAVLSAQPGTFAAPQSALATVVPIVPTADREFLVTQRVTALARLYQGKGRFRPVDVTVRVIDARDRVIVTDERRLETSSFQSATRAADVRFEIPFQRLSPGRYVLSFEAAMGTVTATRDVEFVLR